MLNMLYVCHHTSLQLVGSSMLPTFQPSGDVALVDRVSVALNRLTVGDVVIAICPDNPKILVCKRVTAMAGDHVTVHRGPWRLPSTVHLQVCTVQLLPTLQCCCSIIPI